MNEVKYMILRGNLVVEAFGKMVSIPTDNKIASEVSALIKEGKATKSAVEVLVKPLLTVTQAITNQNSRLVVDVDAQVVTFDGKDLDGVIVDRLIAMVQAGLPIKPIENFLVNLALNPSRRSVKELYNFLEKCDLPITEDGHFLAYKRIRQNYMDKYTGTISNEIGKVVSMPRNEVDDEAQRGCSYGLHFGSKEYFTQSGFGDSSDRLVLVKINPKDVVSVPIEYNFTKGRCCEYLVYEEVPVDFTIQSLYVDTSNEEEYDEDEYEDDYDSSYDDNCLCDDEDSDED